jgi:cytochrome c
VGEVGAQAIEAEFCDEARDIIHQIRQVRVVIKQSKAAEWVSSKSNVLLPAGLSALAAFLFLTTPAQVRAVGAQSAGDADAGKVLFEKRCGGCHSLDTNKEGPALRHAYGQKAGSVSTFKYSKALLSSGVTWDETTMDKWLTSTDSVVPENDMDFQVANAAERANIIRYLKTVAGK